jgi:hypothetical protein
MTMGLTICICGLIYMEARLGEEKIPFHIHPNHYVANFIPTDTTSIVASGTSLSADFAHDNPAVH